MVKDIYGPVKRWAIGCTDVALHSHVMLTYIYGYQLFISKSCET